MQSSNSNSPDISKLVTLSNDEKAEVLYQAWPDSGSSLFRMTSGRDSFDHWRIKGKLTDAEIYVAFDLLRNAGRFCNLGQGWLVKQ